MSEEPTDPLRFPVSGKNASDSSTPIETTEPLVITAELQTAMRRVAVRELAVGALLLGLLLLANGLGVLLLVSPSWSGNLLVSFGGLLLVAGFGLRYVEVPPKLAHPTATLLALGALAVTLTHLAQVPSAAASVHLLLVQVAAALLFVSPAWYAGFVVLSVVSWSTVAWLNYSLEDWAAYGPAMVAASGIGLVLQLRRTRSLTRLTAFWLEQQQRARELEDAVHLAARSQEELVELSVRDPLTGAHNRRFLQQIEFELERPTASWGCLLIDLDGFKEVNDRYGHDEGDRVLQGVAHFIRGHGRADDRLVRLGGDEFVFFMDVKTEDELHLVADRLEREAVKKSPCPFSVGRAFRLPSESMKTVLQRADADMYRHKKKRGSAKTLRMRPIVR